MLHRNFFLGFFTFAPMFYDFNVIHFLMDGEKESQMVQLSPSKLTRHSTLLLRNLKLKVDDKFEKVENFSHNSATKAL